LLSDGSEEAWAPEATDVDATGALYTRVKSGARGGPFRAKFTRHAQASLAPVLVEDGGPTGTGVKIGGGGGPAGRWPVARGCAPRGGDWAPFARRGARSVTRAAHSA